MNIPRIILICALVSVCPLAHAETSDRGLSSQEIKHYEV